MSDALVIKAICRRIQARYGSNHLAAVAADVSPGVWSNYCSDDHPDTTIPMHRVKLVANRAERRALADLLIGDEQDKPACIITEASEATEVAAELQHAVRTARADGDLTPRERKELRGRALHLIAEAGDVVAALDADAA